MKKIFFGLLSFFIFSIITSKGQDVIRTKRDTLRGRVTEIGIDEIKYLDARTPQGPLMVIPKIDVVEINYENGSRYIINPDPYDVNQIVQLRNKSRSIKFEFFSPLTNDIAFGYESMLKVGQNLEVKFGIIGPGTNKDMEKASGVFVKGGVKFLIRPTYLAKGIKFAHQLQGSYIKPEIIFNTYSKTVENYSPYFNGVNYVPAIVNEKIQYYNYAINIVWGKQFILGNSVTFDYYIGMGYGIKESNFKTTLSGYDPTADESYYYSHVFLGSDFPMIISGGVTLGVLF